VLVDTILLLGFTPLKETVGGSRGPCRVSTEVAPLHPADECSVVSFLLSPNIGYGSRAAAKNIKTGEDNLKENSGSRFITPIPSHNTPPMTEPARLFPLRG